MHRDKKIQIVAELTEEIRGATALLVADPRGLDVGQLSDLRRVAARARARRSA